MSNENPMQMINDFRKRIAKGEDVSDEELKVAIKRLHDFRNQAEASSNTKSKTTAAKKAATPKLTKAEAKGLLEDLL